MLAVARNYKEIEQQATARARRAQPIVAVLPANARGSWIILKVAPNHEGIVSGHLIGRGFGMFLPQYPTSYEDARGKKQTVKRNLFPGYVFVFVWGIEKHARRLLSIPGVTGMVLSGPAPVVVPDSMIDHMRAEENRRAPFTYLEEVIVPVGRRKPKNGSKRHVKTVLRERVVDPADIISVQTASFWNRGLDDRKRISMLHKALGLAPLHS